MFAKFKIKVWLIELPELSSNKSLLHIAVMTRLFVISSHYESRVELRGLELKYCEQ